MYAERTSPASEDDNPSSISREDTIKTAYDVFKEVCNVTVTAADIALAYRLKSRCDGPRPLLVSSFIIYKNCSGSSLLSKTDFEI